MSFFLRLQLDVANDCYAWVKRLYSTPNLMKDLVRKGWRVGGAAIVVDPWTVERRESLHIRDRNGTPFCLTMVWRDKKTLYLIHAACPPPQNSASSTCCTEGPGPVPQMLFTPPQMRTEVWGLPVTEPVQTHQRAGMPRRPRPVFRHM